MATISNQNVFSVLTNYLSSYEWDKLKKPTSSKMKRFSDENFNKMGKKPVIKDVMIGAVKLDKEQIKNRVAEYVAAI